MKATSVTQHDEATAVAAQAGYDEVERILLKHGLTRQDVVVDMFGRAIVGLWSGEDRAGLKAKTRTIVDGLVDGIFDSIGN